jgi:hypothetical protein
MLIKYPGLTVVAVVALAMAIGVSMGAPEVAQGGGPGVALVATVAVAGFIAGVTVLTCVGPARRALHIQPTEALRAE